MTFSQPKTEVVLVCQDQWCQEEGAEQVWERLCQVLEGRGVEDVEVIRIACLAHCEEGPNLRTEPGGVLYSTVQPDDIEELVEQHFERGCPLERLISARRY